MQDKVLDADKGVAGVVDMAMTGISDFGVVNTGDGTEGMVTAADRENI